MGINVVCSLLFTDQLMNLICLVTCLFCEALMFSHLEEVSASLWGILSTGQQVHNSLTCSPAVCWLVHVETKWQSARAAGKQTWSEKSTADLGEAASACCCFSLLHLSRGNVKKLFVSSLMLKVRGLSFSPLSDFFFFFSL